jgi:hypothetical protein
MPLFSVTFLLFASLEFPHFILFLCYAFCRLSFLSPCFCFFPTSTKHNFFISFPINLKGEIYFCRNFPSKAFESPSLDVTPPPPPPCTSSFFLQLPSDHFLITLPFCCYIQRAFDLLEHRPELNRGKTELVISLLFSVFYLLTFLRYYHLLNYFPNRSP